MNLNLYTEIIVTFLLVIEEHSRNISLKSRLQLVESKIISGDFRLQAEGAN